MDCSTSSNTKTHFLSSLLVFNNTINRGMYLYLTTASLDAYQTHIFNLFHFYFYFFLGKDPYFQQNRVCLFCFVFIRVDQKLACVPIGEWEWRWSGERVCVQGQRTVRGNGSPASPDPQRPQLWSFVAVGVSRVCRWLVGLRFCVSLVPSSFQYSLIP